MNIQCFLDSLVLLEEPVDIHIDFINVQKKGKVNKRCCSNINFDTIFDLLELRLT